ncbi:transposase [Xenorhabdus bovienii]|nr:transposase [Xenorhabdus bovienii]MDE9555217.1 transposase [Xenorhabdus bovienii]
MLILKNRSPRKPTAGITFIDSTKIVICHNLRIPQNRVFDGVARRGTMNRYLIAYTFQPKKPSLNLCNSEIAFLKQS